MAEVAGTLISTLLRRVRDPQGFATSRTLTRTILSDIQRIVNASSSRVLVTEPLSTSPYRMFYPVSLTFPNSVRVVGVREGRRNLEEMSLRKLNQLSTSWFRHTATRFEAFARVGRDLLVIYPAKKETSSVDVIYTKLTADLVADDTATDLPDEDLHDVMELAEIILLTKMRQFDTLKPLLDRANERMKDRLRPADV